VKPKILYRLDDEQEFHLNENETYSMLIGTGILSKREYPYECFSYRHFTDDKSLCRIVKPERGCSGCGEYEDE
jgi:hypothetical protein